MQQEGPCAALGDEHCFCVNNFWVMRDSMALLRKQINDREQNARAKAGWYENLFNWSPWLTTLLSALTGP